MTSSLDKAIDLKHYLRMIWRRRGIVVLCAIGTLCATLIALAFVPRVYESHVTMIIEDSQLLSAELEKLMGGIMQPSSRYGVEEERMAKLSGRVLSRPFLERVIRILKMDKDPGVRAQVARERGKPQGVTPDEMAMRILVGNLQSRIRFESFGKGVYEISVADYSPENAQLLAKWISELYMDVSNQSAIDRLKVAHEFGVGQLRIYEQQLRDSERSLERYKGTMIQRSLTRRLVRSDNLALAEALYRRMADDAAAIRIRVKAYASALADQKIDADQLTLSDDPSIADQSANFASALKNEMASRLANSAGETGGVPSPGAYGALRSDLLKSVEAAAARRYPEASPELVGVIARYVFARIDLDAQDGAASILGGALADFKREAQSTPGGEIELTRLEQDVETNRKLLQSFQAQLVASDVSRAVEMTKLGLRIEILDPANLPLSPTRPNRPKIVLAAILLGPLIGMGFAFLSEVGDPTLRTLEDFARIVPEPVLGTTPLLSRLVERRRWIHRHWISAAVTGVILLTFLMFVARTSILHDLVLRGQPVQMVNPEGMLNEDTR